MAKIFKDSTAKSQFTKKFHLLPAEKQEAFGAAIRRIADDKVTRLDLVDDFYVDEFDVLSEYNKLLE